MRTRSSARSVERLAAFQEAALRHALTLPSLMRLVGTQKGDALSLAVRQIILACIPI